MSQQNNIEVKLYVTITKKYKNNVKYYKKYTNIIE